MPILTETLDNLLITCNAYFVRINKHPDYQDTIETLQESPKILSCLCVEHKGSTSENPHYHLCIHTEQKPPALRKWLKSKFTEGTGNGHMSIKEWDKDRKTLQYCFHEPKASVIVQKGYSTKFIESLRADALVFENNKKTYGSLIEEKAFKLIVMDGCPRENQVEHQYVAYKIWDACKEHSFKYPNKFQLEQIISSIQANLTTMEDAVLTFEEVKNNWYQKMYNY